MNKLTGDPGVAGVVTAGLDSAVSDISKVRSVSMRKARRAGRRRFLARTVCETSVGKVVRRRSKVEGIGVKIPVAKAEECVSLSVEDEACGNDTGCVV
jgi:hypothetical protein